MVPKITVIVDTNIYFSALYNWHGNEAEILKAAGKGELILISPDTVQEELKRILQRKLNYSAEEASSTIKLLPTIWIPRSEYMDFLLKAENLLEHKEDAPILASALTLKAGILTGNKKHFDKSEITELAEILTSKEILQIIKKAR